MILFLFDNLIFIFYVKCYLLFICLQILLESKYPTTLLGNFIKQRLIDNTAKRFENIEKQGLTPHFLEPHCWIQGARKLPLGWNRMPMIQRHF